MATPASLGSPLLSALDAEMVVSYPTPRLSSVTILGAILVNSLQLAISAPGWAELLSEDGAYLVGALINLASSGTAMSVTMLLLGILLHVSTVKSSLGVLVKLPGECMVRLLVAILRGGFPRSLVTTAVACLPDDLRHTVWSEILQPCEARGMLPALSPMDQFHSIPESSLGWLLYVDGAVPSVTPWLISKLQPPVVGALLSCPGARLDLSYGTYRYLMYFSAEHLVHIVPRLAQDRMMAVIDVMTQYDWRTLTVPKLMVLLPYLSPYWAIGSLMALLDVNPWLADELYDQHVVAVDYTNYSDVTAIKCSNWPEYTDRSAARCAAVTRLLYISKSWVPW